MADISGLVKALKDKAVAQYNKGAPYRDALASALRGDMGGVNQALSKSELTPMDFATTFAPMGITAWHGSPHTFEKFDLSKIGTGEGAQNAGYGVYVSESPNVASTFMTPSKGIGQTASEALIKYGTPEKAIENLLNKNPITNLGKEYNQSVIDYIQAGKASKGNLYKLDVADEILPNMLHWEKPLSEQNDFVKNFINQLNDKYRPLDELEAKNVTGERLYRRIENKLGSKEASKLLNDVGISGIKYADPGSYGVKPGATNYVVFDPNTIKILERQ